MSSYKEIVTKAIAFKGKKYFKNSYSVEALDEPTTVLGCWVINHKFKGYKSGDKIGVDGSFDINIWYSYDGDSKTTVISKKIEYNDLFNVNDNSDDLKNDTDIIVRSLKQPSCGSVKVSGNVISFEIEKELGVEIVGEVKMKIAVEDDEEPWNEIFDDDKVDETMSDIDKEVDENYLEK